LLLPVRFFKFGCLTVSSIGGNRVFAFIVKRFRVFRAPLHRVFGAAPDVEAGQIDPLSPQHVVSLVQFLASPAAAEVNGQVFIVYGPQVTLVSPPHMERRFSADGTSWDPTELTATLRDYFAGRDPEQSFSATDLMHQ
ncbi:hypothetical protein ABLN67_11590, partial [Mycobacterium tuberculosis]